MRQTFLAEGVPSELIPCAYDAVSGIRAALAERDRKEAAGEDDDTDGLPISSDVRYASDPGLAAPCFGDDLPLPSLLNEGLDYEGDGSQQTASEPSLAPVHGGDLPPTASPAQDGRRSRTAKQLKAIAAKTARRARSRRSKLELMEISARAARPKISLAYSDVAVEKVDFSVVDMGANKGGFTSRVVCKGSATVLDQARIKRRLRVASAGLFSAFPYTPRKEWTEEELIGKFQFQKLEWKGGFVNSPFARDVG